MNLLPEKERRKVEKEKKLRVALVVFLFISVTAALSLIFLAPSLFLSRSKVNSVTRQIDLVQQYITKRQESDVGAEARNIRDKLNFLDSKNKTITVTDTLSTLFAEMIPGTSLQSISFRKQSDTEATISIRGKADDREILLRFAKRLEDQPMFNSVVLPISNLVRNADLDFSITFNVGEHTVE